MMIDVGAYGALGGFAPVGLATDTFRDVASAASNTAAQLSGDAYKTATQLGNRIATLNPLAISRAKKQWDNLARDIQRMGGVAATQGQSFIQEQAMQAGREAARGARDEMKPYLYAGAAIAGVAALYLVFRK
jgi:hypothetical protein